MLFSQAYIQQKRDTYDRNIGDVNFCSAYKVSLPMVSEQRIFHALKICKIAHLIIWYNYSFTARFSLVINELQSQITKIAFGKYIFCHDKFGFDCHE
jgi:hypothetical protein